MNDYGEDLFVQTSHSDHMEATRLWLQVKGTEDINRHRLKQGDLRLTVPFDHAVRWARTTDLAIVVLWDVSNEMGWYAVPRLQVDEWEGLLSPRSTMTLRFSAKDLFTPQIAEGCIWQSRLLHHKHRLLNARNIESDAPANDRGAVELRTVILLELAQLLEITEPRQEPDDGVQLNRELAYLYLEWFDRLSDEGADPKEAIYQSAIIAVVVWIKLIADPAIGIPKILIEGLVEIVIGCMGLTHFLNDASD